MRIEELDRNMIIPSNLDLEDLEYIPYHLGAFTVSGVAEYSKEARAFSRLPLAFLKDFKEKYPQSGVIPLSYTPAGVRIRFITNSPYIAIKNVLGDGSVSGYLNFDLFKRVGDSFSHIRALSSIGNKGDFETFAFPATDGKLNEYEIYMPILTCITEFYIGLKKGSTLLKPNDYAISDPIVFYGSSITHGASSVRPGNAYTAIVSRNLCADYINLGFSGNAKGEPELAEYIASLKMSAFVLDYDHNAPSPEHLEQTHENFYKIIREKQPDLPIIMVTKPDNFDNSTDKAIRRQIVFNTYYNALMSGDENVYFIDGTGIMSGEFSDTTLADGCHPSESGFVLMAGKIGSVVKSAILKK